MHQQCFLCGSKGEPPSEGSMGVQLFRSPAIALKYKSPNPYVCSLHFEEKFLNRRGGSVFLRKDAMPTKFIFLHPSSQPESTRFHASSSSPSSTVVPSGAPAGPSRVIGPVNPPISNQGTEHSRRQEHHPIPESSSSSEDESFPLALVSQHPRLTLDDESEARKTKAILPPKKRSTSLPAGRTDPVQADDPPAAAAVRSGPSLMEPAIPYSSASLRTMTYTQPAPRATHTGSRAFGRSLWSFGTCQVFGEVSTTRSVVPTTVESAGRLSSSSVSMAQQHHEDPIPAGEVSSWLLLCAAGDPLHRAEGDAVQLQHHPRRSPRSSSSQRHQEDVYAMRLLRIKDTRIAQLKQKIRQLQSSASGGSRPYSLVGQSPTSLPYSRSAAAGLHHPHRQQQFPSSSMMAFQSASGASSQPPPADRPRRFLCSDDVPREVVLNLVRSRDRIHFECASDLKFRILEVA